MNRAHSKLYRCWIALFLLLPGVLAAGCDLDWTVRPNAVKDADPAPDVERDTATSPPDDADVDADADADTDADAGTDATVDADAGADADAGDGGSDADAGTTCSASNPCPAGTYCVYPDHYCGSSILNGRCVPRPTSCLDAPIEPVCGCGGGTYTSPCAAAMSGNDLSLQACTTTPPSSFKCGYRFCDSTEPCVITGTGANAVYTCRAASCLLCLCSLSCLGGTCGTEDGHIVLRCP